MHDLPHTAIIFTGNDNIFEYNEIYCTGYATTESGAIYTGRDFSFHGNEIRYNYFHDLYGPDLQHGGAIHLDDAVSGIRVHGNIFARMCWGIYLCGGRHVHITNNLFLDCAQQGIGAGYRNYANINIRALEKMPYKTLPWSTRFPELLSTLTDMPDYPRGSTIIGNISYGGRFIRWQPEEGGNMDTLKASITTTNNFDSPRKTIEVRRINDKLNAKIPEEVLESVAGFIRLPVEKMGVYHDKLRASWPVDYMQREVPVVWRIDEKNKPIAKVSRANPALKIDGIINPQEWKNPDWKGNWGDDPNYSIPIERTPDGKTVIPKSIAYVRQDAKYLYIGVENPLDSLKSLKIGEDWGKCDAVEVALQNKKAPAGMKSAPTFVLRGYASGKFVCISGEGEYSTETIALVQEIKYAVNITKEQWSAEWAIPLIIFGEDHHQIACNITVRKTGDNLWIMWCETGGNSTEVERAGILELAK